MTNEEMERGIEFLLKNQATVETQIEFLLKNQATLETQMERTSRQVEETHKRLEETNIRLEETNIRLESYAETQSQFIQIVTRHIEAQGEINASLRASLARTDDRLDALIDIVRQERNGKS